MEALTRYLGLASAVIGALLCAVAGVARLMGGYFVANFEATTLFMVGIGLMVFACTLKLYR